MCHSTSTVLRSYLRTMFSLFCSVSSVLCFLPFFLCFLCFSVLLLDSSVFPLISLFLFLVPLFSLYFPYIFLSILSTTYRSYLRTVLRSFTGRPILRRNSFLTTLGDAHLRGNPTPYFYFIFLDVLLETQ